MKQSRRTFLCNAALASGAMKLYALDKGGETPDGLRSFLSPGVDERSGPEELRRQFRTPEKRYRPLVRWWWPGNDVTDEELQREIALLDDACVGGAEIQAFFKGLPVNELSEGELRRINGYASDSFFRHVAAAAETAHSRGMFIDYTFGSGWPFGGGEAITPELASIELRSTHVSVRGPATMHQLLQIPHVTDGDLLRGDDIFSGLPPGWAERLKQRAKVVAVVAVRGEDAEWDLERGTGREQGATRSGRLEHGTSVDLTTRLQPDGTLDWEIPEGTWQIFVFCSLPTVQRVNGAAGEGPQLVLDHLNAAAFAAHANRVGDRAVPFLKGVFGNGLRAAFCDSLEVRASLFWSDDFLAEFRRRRGYDLLPYLPVLKVQTFAEPFDKFFDLPQFEMEGIGSHVRHDYHQTVSDLIIERFYEQFNQWAHDHNLLSRTQAHGAPGDVLRIYGEADIPETETLYDRGTFDFLKLAASAAHVNGRSLVGSESFVWTNALYQTTPEKVKVTADQLLTAGVNAIVYHGFAYVFPGLPAPGWHPFSGMNGSGNYSSQINQFNPFWPYLAQLNAYITRLQFVSQEGRNVAAVALLRERLAHGAEEVPPAPRLNQGLLNAGYDYDHINANSLLKCNAREAMLDASGGAEYRALVVPRMDSIDADVAEKLVQLASEGIPIFSEGMPAEAAGWLHKDQNTVRVQAAMRKIRTLPNVSVTQDVAGTLEALRRRVDPNIRFRSRPLAFFQKRLGRMNTYFVRNDSDAIEHLDAEFQATGTPELWDPWTGRTVAAVEHQRAGHWTRVNIDLQPLSSALIVFGPDVAAPANSSVVARKLTQRIAVGSSGWRLEVTGIVAGKMGTIRRDLDKLIDWSLDSELRAVSGRGVYTTSFTVPETVYGRQIVLDLGMVRDVAEVHVNGKEVATLLLRPYEADVSDAVLPGSNQLVVAVTNALFNSMVLREPRIFRPAGTENPCGLMSAGLIGPVQLKVMR